MRILFFITGLTRGGAEKHLFDLVSGLVKKREMRIKVIALVGGCYQQKLEKLGVKAAICSERPSRNPFKYILFFRREVLRFKPDIVHTFLFHANIIAKLALVFLKKDFYLICTYQTLISRYPLVRLLELVNMRQVDLMVSNSRRADQDLAFYNLLHINKKVINNGFAPRPADSLQAEELKRKYQDKKLILTVANFRPMKDYATNLLTCRQLAQQRSDFVFLYLGGGWQLKKVKKQAEKMSLGKSVEFLGIRGDVLEVLSAADVFFLPTRFESQSNALIEAMFMRVPIVTTDIPENRELVPRALFCRPGDYVCMSQAINEILKNGFPEPFLRLNRNFVLSSLSLNKMVNSYYQTYLKLLEVDNFKTR